MPTELYACVIALFSRMCVISCCLFLLHMPVTSGILYHTEVRYVHVHTGRTTTELQIVPIRDINRHTEATMSPVACSPCTFVYIWSSLGQYLSTDCASDTACS